MGQILIEPTPRLKNTSIFDSEGQRGGVQITKFPNLRYKGNDAGQNVGGRFSLPQGFDGEKFASAFVPEGNEVQAMQTDQPVIGTGYVSDGWQVWKNSTDQPHKVHDRDQNGPVYVLMFRPIEVQQQVNEAYGLLSIDQMTAEVRGDTIGGKPADDRGMLNEKRLASTHVDADLAADREAEEHLGRSSVVQTTLQTPNERLTKPPQKVSR